MLNHSLIKRIERSLHLSTLEGMAYGAVQGSGEHFVSAYAVALGATNTQLGLLTSIPSLLGALAQSASVRLVALMGSRKRVVLLFAALSAFMWLPILGVGYLFPSHGAIWLIAFLAFYVTFGMIVVPPWGSIMAEAVPDRMRGRYFGQRSRWSTLANVTTFLIGGALLYLFRDQGFTGFALVFALAFGFRLLSFALLTTLLDLPHPFWEEGKLGLRLFLSDLPRTNLGRTMMYIFAVNFVVNLAGPFFVAYQLRELKFDYMTFTILEMIAILATLWAVPHWGAAADRAGNRSMLVLSGVLISMVPLVWLVSGNPVYLGFVQFYTGLAWAGFNLVSTNFIYDATTPQNRTAYLAYFNAGVGIATSLGALTGGLLIDYVPPLLGSAILSMFLLSGSLRLLAAAAFLPHIQEVRRVRAMPAVELFYIMLGGRAAHRPAHYGRMHHPLHGHREPEDVEAAEHPELLV